MPVPFTLPTPCPTCGGPVTYSGAGRRPVTCSPACKAARDVASRPDRRALAREAQEDPRLAAIYAYQEASRLEGQRERAAAALGASLVPASLDVEAVPVDYRRDVRARADDPAAAWLARCHPEELADFPEDEFLGSTR